MEVDGRPYAPAALTLREKLSFHIVQENRGCGEE